MEKAFEDYDNHTNIARMSSYKQYKACLTAARRGRQIDPPSSN
jgi:hypothetical protein